MTKKTNRINFLNREWLTYPHYLTQTTHDTTITYLMTPINSKSANMLVITEFRIRKYKKKKKKVMEYPFDSCNE